MTAKQRHVLEALSWYEKAVTARQLADRLERPKARTQAWDRAEVRGVLERLEVKGLVHGWHQEGRKIWLVTPEGRRFLNDTRPARSDGSASDT